MKTSMSFFLTLLVSLMLVLCGANAQEDHAPTSLSGDWTGSGNTEILTWRKIGSNEAVGTFFQVLLLDENRKKIWSSPAVMEENNPMAFGEWHFGVSLPTTAWDITGSGQDVWMAPAPQSDVSPTFFRVFRWKGNGFTQEFVKALTGDAKVGGKFAWTSKPSSSQWWVQSWGKRDGKGIWATAILYPPSSSGVQEEKIFLVPSNGQFLVEKSTLAGKKASQPSQSSLPPANAKTSYRARLSAADHVNSSGQPLKTVADILRQDRANFHKYNVRDQEDASDPWFASAENRALISSYPVQVAGGDSAKQRILNGTPLVEVTLRDGTLFVTVLSK